jgi:hypothetical protein
VDGTVSLASTVATSAPRDRWLATSLSVVAVTWGAALVFAVQPMLGRMLLPGFGGAPAVWLTALVFFQVALLLGYLYAHLLDRMSGRRQLAVYGGTVVIAVVSLPAGVPNWGTPSSAAAVWVLAALAAGAGVPYVVAAATGPLLHSWYARGRGARGSDPYFLYAASNVGSLGALLAYPIVIEPNLDLDRQATAWSVAFLGLIAVGLASALAWRIHRASGAVPSDRSRTRPAAGVLVRWGAYAAVPSALLVGSTRYLTTDIAPVPLLWVIPLAVYLVTFIVAFRPERRQRPRRRHRRPAAFASTLLGSLVVLIAIVWQGTVALPTWASFTTHLAVLGAAGAVAHGRLARERPSGEHATAFLLAVAAGGAGGSVLVAIVAPMLLPIPLEYPLALGAALLVAGVGGPRLGPPATAVFAGLGVLAAAWLLPGAVEVRGLEGTVAFIAVAAALVGVVRTVAPRPVLLAAFGLALLLPAVAPSAATLHAERTFFADHRVLASEDGVRTLVHGTTIHGSQDPSQPDVPTAYYHRDGPVADLMALGGGGEIGVLGLGVGALTAYGGPDDRFTFFEIDPAVERIATDPSLFTYLHRTPSAVEVEIADGRLGVEAAGPGAFDMLVVDAFTSDAIPVHLLTVEAIAAYLDAVGDGAVVALNVSNRYLDLVPVVAAAAEELGASVRVRADGGGAVGPLRSRWVAFADDDAVLAGLGERWSRPEAGTTWTDRAAPIWRAIDWRGGAVG